MTRSALLTPALAIVSIIVGLVAGCDSSGPDATPTRTSPTVTPTPTARPRPHCGDSGGISATPGALWVVEHGSVLASADAGHTWSEIGPEDTLVNGVDVTDSQTGFVATNSGVFGTRDAGKTWRLVSSRVAAQIEFADEQYAWMTCGDVISLTEDGGSTWRDVANPCRENESAHLAYDDATRSVWLMCTGPGAGTFMSKALFRRDDDMWTVIGDAPFPSDTPHVEGWLTLGGNAWDLAVYNDVILIGYGRSPTVRLVRTDGELSQAVIHVCNDGALSSVALASDTELYVRGNLEHDGNCQYGLYRSADGGMTWD